MGLLFKIKVNYLAFIGKSDHRGAGKNVYRGLIALSHVYGLIIAARNALYDSGLIKAYRPKAKVIAIGNLSWAGSGKTPLSIWLYERLNPLAKSCVVRRGYGDDENKMLEERVGSVSVSLNRCALIRKKEDFFNIFILDDGFQYRKLMPTVSVVIMGAREFIGTYRLIPASYFREPFANVRRADIVVISHSQEIAEKKEIIGKITAVGPHLKIYFADYAVKSFKGLDGRVYSQSFLADKPSAAFAAIGYPQGFFKKIKELNFDLRRSIAYPDHHRLSVQEFLSLEDSLLREGIHYLLITHKDKYHFPYQPKKLKIIVIAIDFVFDDEQGFLSDVKQRLGLKQ